MKAMIKQYNDKAMINPVNEIKEFEATLNTLKRQARNQFGHMFPFCKH